MASSTPRPTFRTLLTTLQSAAPLLPHTPGPSPAIPNLTAQIANAQLHPTLEAALHILNHDLTSAHFLVRHMQSAPKYEGMYLHGILHRVEGDYDNSRMWYHDVRGSEVYERVWGTASGLDGDGKDKVQEDSATQSLKSQNSSQQTNTNNAPDDDDKDDSEGKTDPETSTVLRKKGFKDIQSNREPYSYSGSLESSLDAGQIWLNRVQHFKTTKGSTPDRADMERESARELQVVIEFCASKFGEGRVLDARQAWVRNNEEISKMSEDQIGGDKGHRKF